MRKPSKPVQYIYPHGTRSGHEMAPTVPELQSVRRVGFALFSHRSMGGMHPELTPRSWIKSTSKELVPRMKSMWLILDPQDAINCTQEIPQSS
jgi:hypothetical protein